MRNLASGCRGLRLVDFGVKQREVVAAQMVEHAGFFEVIAFSEDAHVSVGFHYFADENRVVARCEFVFYGAFKVRDAFADGWRLHFFGGHRRQVCFFEFVKASSCQGAAGVDGLKYLQCRNVHDEFA